MNYKQFLLLFGTVLLTVGSLPGASSLAIRQTGQGEGVSKSIRGSAGVVERISRWKRDDNNNGKGSGFSFSLSQAIPGLGSFAVSTKRNGGATYSFGRSGNMQQVAKNIQRINDSVTGMFRDMSSAASRTMTNSANRVNNGIQQWTKAVRQLGQAATNRNHEYSGQSGGGNGRGPTWKWNLSWNTFGG